MSKRLLLDTHAFLWCVASSEKLSDTAKSAVLEKGTDVFLSKVSYWEICLKVSIGKLALMPDWEAKLEAERKANRFAWLEISPKHCEGIISLPWHHKDPFDRLLVSQARAENLSLLSCDDKIEPYGIDIIW